MIIGFHSELGIEVCFIVFGCFFPVGGYTAHRTEKMLDEGNILLAPSPAFCEIISSDPGGFDCLAQEIFVISVHRFAPQSPYFVAREFLQTNFVGWGKRTYSPLDIFPSGVIRSDVFLRFCHVR
jgi:hypothetical protein